MKFNLRLINLSDSDTLYEWVNDPVTRKVSFNSHFIEREEHDSYIKSIIGSKTKNQFILEVDGKGVGTVKESINENDIELTYAISPEHRGKRIAPLMMHFYLHDRKGVFLCRIKGDNIPSIKMVERCGFTLTKVDADGVLHYNINITR